MELREKLAELKADLECVRAELEVTAAEAEGDAALVGALYAAARCVETAHDVLAARVVAKV